MRRLPLALTPALVALALAAPARAATATTSTAPAAATAASPTPTTPATPAPAPAGGTLRLSWVAPIVVRGHRLALSGRALVVRGRVSNYVAGQKVVVEAYRNGRRYLLRSVAVQGVGGGLGGFALSVTPRDRGSIGVTAVHAATPQQHAMTASPLRITAYRPAAHFGERNPVVDLVQRQLLREHYAVVRSQRFDGSTARALLAFRKVNGMRRNGTLNRSILRMLLAGKGQFRPKYPTHGRHVEADLSRQVLALVDPGGHVYRVYHISSGKPSTPTVLGSYRFYRKSLGTNAEGMVDSSYFIRGYAVHGYASVPVFAASHGCLRVPVPSARSIFRWIRVGERIDVYP